MPTNTPKRFLAALLLAPTVASAQLSFEEIDFDWWDLKEFRQVGPSTLLYLGGFTDVFFRDGGATLSPCPHPVPFIIPPSLPCPLGTTGFVAQGDIDLDGFNDEGNFYSIATVVRASIVEPFRSDQFRILSAPPSGIADLLRSTNGDTDAVFAVQDTSVVIWYNVLAPPVDDYELTLFEAHRHYGAGSDELQRHYDDVPWGSYLFTLPEINSQFEPPRPVPFGVTHLVTPDGYPGRGAVPSGWRLTNGNWFSDEIHIDPRTFFVFTWTGLNVQNTLVSDLMFLSARGNQYIDVNGTPRVENPPEFIVTGSFTGAACNVLETTLDFDRELDQGKIYVLNITGGDLVNTNQYPVTVFGTGGGLASNEILSLTDVSGGVVTGRITGAAGTTLTTNRDLLGCLVPGTAYELEFLSGALAGSAPQFPIQTWGIPGAMDFTTLIDVSASITPGDTFRLSPKELVVTSTVQQTAGFFVRGDLDLSPFPRGGDYRIVVTSGALTGSVIPLRNYGFPNNFWFETQQDLSGSLMPGDTYEMRIFSPPTNRIKIGDTFAISQTFEDWIQDKYDNNEVLGVDELTLRCGFLIEHCPPAGPPPYLAELEVDVGLLGPIYAVARPDHIVFPPYPILTPTADRDPFLLGTFDAKYELGPFFYRTGDSMTGILNLDRAVPGGNFTTDNVNRILNFRINFIDTYEGFAILGGLSNEGFPFGTPNSQRLPHLDFDRDGASNVLEFAMQTDVADPNDTPTFQFALLDGPGQCMATVTKRPNIGERLIYFFEYSTDLVNWTTILPGDPNFDILVDNETTLTVSNAVQVGGGLNPIPPPNCFLRIRVELN